MKTNPDSAMTCDNSNAAKSPNRHETTGTNPHDKTASNPHQVPDAAKAAAAEINSHLALCNVQMSESRLAGMIAKHMTPYIVAAAACELALNYHKDVFAENLQGVVASLEDAVNEVRLSQAPTEEEITQFITEFDEGKHPLSAEDEAALERGKERLFTQLRNLK